MMDVYISEEYVVRRRIEKKTATKACKMPSNDGASEAIASKRLEEKERTFRSQPCNHLDNNDAISSISTANSSEYGKNVVFTYLSA